METLKPQSFCGVCVQTERAAEKLWVWREMGRLHPSGAKALAHSVCLTRGLKPPPPSVPSSSAACKALAGSVGLMRGLKPPASLRADLSAACKAPGLILLHL